MTKTNTANASTTMSPSKACITAAVFCCLLALFVPESAEAIDIENCMDRTEKAVMYRNSDSRASCVSLSSVEKLEQRGWGSYNPLDPIMPRIVEFGTLGRPLVTYPILGQEITPSYYDRFVMKCAKLTGYTCSLHLNNDTEIYNFLKTDMEKYFTVDPAK